MSPQIIDRRRLLKGTLGAAATLTVLTAPPALANVNADQALIDAEVEITRLYEACRDRDVDAEDADWRRATDLDVFMATTAPATLAGAAVKLRRVLDATVGIANGEGENDIKSLAQVLALVHTMAGAPTYPTRPTITGDEDAQAESEAPFESSGITYVIDGATGEYSIVKGGAT